MSWRLTLLIHDVTVSGMRKTLLTLAACGSLLSGAAIANQTDAPAPPEDSLCTYWHPAWGAHSAGLYVSQCYSSRRGPGTYF